MDREKGQYLGDGCYSALAQGILTGNFALFEKLVREALRSGFVNPGLMTCSPCSFMQEIADYPLLLPLAVTMYYHLTGREDFLAEVFPGLRAMLLFYRDAYAREEEGGLLNRLDKWCVVEWPPNFRDGYDVPDMEEGQVCGTLHNVINALYIGAGKFLNRIAGLIGEPPVLDTAPLVRAFQGAFYDGSLFRDSVLSSHRSLPGNAYPLLFNLCPDRSTEDRIIALIRRKRLGASLFFVSYAILGGLVRKGRRDLVRELIADEGAWLRMLREGATVTWEAWGRDCKWNTSLFHLCLTYPVHFLYDWNMEAVFEGI